MCPGRLATEPQRVVKRFFTLHSSFFTSVNAACSLTLPFSVTPRSLIIFEHGSHELIRIFLASNLSTCLLVNSLTKKKQMNIKFNWSTIKKIIQLIITILTSVIGTLAVQSCM